MTTRTKIIAGVVMGGILLLGAYLVFFNTSTTDVVSTDSASASQAEVTFLNLATQAGSISFDTSILSDPRFTTLIDTRTAITAVPEGRRDPFASVPGIVTN